jgi:heat shock protein HtpX
MDDDMIDYQKITDHRLTNLLYTLVLFGGMLALLAVLGFTLGDGTGLLWAIGLGLLFLLFTRQVSPELILRMYGARPLSAHEAPGLYRLVRELARRANLPSVPKLYLLSSRLTNAVTVGDRENAAIALTGNLTDRLNARELAGVLAHEISHIQYNDTRVKAVAATLGRVTSLFSFFGQVLLFFNLPLLLMGRGTISWLAILLLIFAPTLSGLMQLALSRRQEFNADLGAIRLTGDPEGMAGALQKLEYYQSSLLRRIFLPGYRAPETDLFRTHPQTRERVRRLLEVRGETLTVPPMNLEELLNGPTIRPVPLRGPGWTILGMWR